MLTLADYLPATVADLGVLTPTALFALRGLVYRSHEYRENIGYYGDVYALVKVTVAAGKTAYAVPEVDRDATQIEQVALAQTLAAVVNKLSQLPGIAVESQGSDTRRNFLSSTDNWEELAKDVLDALFQPLGNDAIETHAYLTVNRKMFDCVRQFGYPDELFLTLRGVRPYIIGCIE